MKMLIMILIYHKYHIINICNKNKNKNYINEVDKKEQNVEEKSIKSIIVIMIP